MRSQRADALVVTLATVASAAVRARSGWGSASGCCQRPTSVRSTSQRPEIPAGATPQLRAGFAPGGSELHGGLDEQPLQRQVPWRGDELAAAHIVREPGLVGQP